MRHWAWLVLLLGMGTSPAAARAEVRLPEFLSSHMVLQRGVDAPLWGWAEPGETVTVSVGDRPLSPVQADAEGRWRVAIPAGERGGQQEAFTITVSASNRLTLTNVVWGDVWLCAGQSNMAMGMFQSQGGKEDIAAADLPGVRLLSIARRPAAEPQANADGRWKPCSPAVLGPFSAVAFYFGRAIHEDQGVPIGLINASFGGTPAEAWTPREAMAAEPSLAPLLERRAKYEAAYPQLQGAYEQALAAWEASEPQAEKTRPRAPRRPDHHPRFATVLYNAMIHPLTPLRIKGAIWYQGESNAARADEYRSLLPALIRGWRQGWGQGDFPFAIVQLPNYHSRRDEPVDEPWARLREAQALTAATVPHCGLVVTIDVGEASDIHPRNKRDVGQRLAGWALANVYGRDVAWSGPVYRDMQIEEGAIRIRFNHAGGGLATTDGGPVRGFAVAGADQQFVWADVKIEDSELIVSSPAVAKPVAVRYAWANNPACNLTNQANLPAAPFRTDAWPQRGGN